MTALSGSRILITTDAVGGVWTFSATLARALAKRGVHVSLVTLGPPPSEAQLDHLRGVPNLEVEIADFALEWMDPEGEDVDRTCHGLQRIAQRVRPDLVHLNGYREALCPWPSPVLVVAHSCVRSWWLACRGKEPAEARWTNYMSNVAAALELADMWVAPSKAFRDRIQSLYAPARPGHVIHNGIDNNTRPRPKEGFVLAAGRLWDEAKKVDTLLAIADTIDWPIKLAGSTSASGTALHRNVEALGDISRGGLLNLMARASIFVAPAVYEPFGLSVLEAAAAGCALILSDIPTFRELWSGAAVFVQPRNTQQLAEALQRVCRDADLRAELQRAARLRAGRYSAATMLDGYCQAYERLLGNVTSNASSTQRDLAEVHA
jgi:glycosyltransferase involved in cell wall biosynthesis